MNQKELNEKMIRVNFWEQFNFVPTFEQMEAMVL